MLAEEVAEIPWYVRLRIPVDVVRERLFKSPNHELSSISGKQWNAFLRRKRTGQLKYHRGANTRLRCPSCGHFLTHFYITSDLAVRKKAEKDKETHRLISGYICWVPCGRTYFSEDLSEQSRNV